MRTEGAGPTDVTPSTADRVEIPFLRLTGQLWKLKLAVLLPWPAVFVGYCNGGRRHPLTALLRLACDLPARGRWR